MPWAAVRASLRCTSAYPMVNYLRSSLNETRTEVGSPLAQRGYGWDRKFGEFGSYTQYERFNSQVTGRSGWSAWLAFVAAFPAKAAAVFLWGLLSTGFYLVLPFNFEAFERSLTAGVHTHKTAAIFIACFIGALGFSWLKSYAELSLVQGVRFLAFRVF